MPKLSSAIIDHCSPSQLKALLSLASRPLGGPAALSSQTVNPEELSRLLTELCQGQAESGELLLTTVCEEETPIEALRGIKELAKQLSAEAKTEAQRQAATVLYHAAVAAAFGRRGADISSRPLSSRSTLYEDLAAMLAGHPLGAVFRQAVEREADTGAA